jgi:adhesin/invasin
MFTAMAILAAPSWADAPSVTVVLAPSTVAADGASTTTATATVHDASGNPVAGETVAFGSSDAGDAISGVTDNGDGTYSATITSSTTPGQATITASDAALSASGQATLIEQGPATSVQVMLAPGSIIADGSSTTTATAIVQDAAGNPVAGDNVTFSSTDAGDQFGTVSGHADGTYSVTMTSSTTVGTPTITATDNTAGVSGGTMLMQTAGPVASVVLSLAPNPIVADGLSTSTATAVVKDAEGHPLSGEPLALSSGATDLGSMTDQGGGTYTASVTSTTTAGNRTITATDGTVSNDATLTQVAGPAAQVVVSLLPASIPADGASTSVATATVTDAHSNRVAGDVVAFSSSDPGVHFGSVTNNHDGTYTATLTSSTTAGTPSITATDGSVSGHATLTQTPGPAAHVSVSLNPTSVVANGTSTSAATATVTDANNNPVAGDGVTFTSSDSGIHHTAVVDHGDGTYTTTLTSSTTAGTPTITATDGTVQGQATLTQTPGPATHAQLTLQPTSIIGNGLSQSMATLTVVDANHNGVPGEPIHFASTDSGGNPSGELIGQVTDNGDGTYTALIRSSTALGQFTIKGTDTRANIAGQATLTQTVGPATHVAVSLNQSSIVADGTSTSIATATITDALGNAIVGDNVSFSSSDANVHFGAVTNNHDGTYTATLTSSTVAGTPTIAATDNTTGVSGQMTLTQTPGPAAHVSVSLQPATVVANGIAVATATATVTDAHGNRVPGDTVFFSSNDHGDQFIQDHATPNGDGTYSVPLTSLTTGTSTITASDGNVSGQATLTKVSGQSTTALVVPPSAVVSNQQVTLVALVAAASGQRGAPHGTISFKLSGTPIAGCASQPVSPSTGSASCTTSFGASVGMARLSAVFSPDALSSLDASTGTASLAVTRDSTSVTLGLSSLAPKIGATENLVAFVTPAHTGSVSPSGTVTFFDNGSPIAHCTGQPVLASGGGGTATCAVSYTASASHKISATYNGDANFAGSQATPVSVPVQFLGTLKASMHWSFVSGPGYTSVLALTVNGAPIGSTVLVNCKGKGCPFANKSLPVSKTKRCGPKGKRVCLTHGNIDLTSRFARRHLRPRTTITVDVVQPGWIGRAYTFVVRAHKAPSTKAVCVVPGTSASTSC